jgi:hypothetical protein
MFGWFYRICIASMENIYVWMDARVVRPKQKIIIGFSIDEDFQNMDRRGLCNHAEKRFGLDKDELWDLQSTSKIRLACQLARNMRDSK